MEISVWGCFPRFPVTLWNVCSFEFALYEARSPFASGTDQRFCTEAWMPIVSHQQSYFWKQKKTWHKSIPQDFLHFSYFCSIFKPFFIFPFPMEIVEALETGSSEGVGLLVDAKRGLILTDRHSAPQSLGATEAVRCGVHGWTLTFWSLIKCITFREYMIATCVLWCSRCCGVFEEMLFFSKTNIIISNLSCSEVMSANDVNIVQYDAISKCVSGDPCGVCNCRRRGERFLSMNNSVNGCEKTITLWHLGPRFLFIHPQQQHCLRLSWCRPCITFDHFRLRYAKALLRLWTPVAVASAAEGPCAVEFSKERNQKTSQFNGCQNRPWV